MGMDWICMARVRARLAVRAFNGLADNGLDRVLAFMSDD